MPAWFRNNTEKIIFILFVCLLISGLFGVIYALLPNFDFYTYHYYSGWAFWNDRLGIDFMPCQSRTYFNPLLDAVNYLFIEKLNNHPYTFLFLSNLKYGLFVFLSYLISDFIFKNGKTKNIGIISTIFMVLLSPIIIFTMRMDFTDIQVANIILISFYIFIKYIFNDTSKKKTFMMFLSALILGLGIGLKYSIIIFALPLAICSFIYLKRDFAYLRTILYMLLGGILGLIITDGWWLYIIWSHFGNPLFPYFNNIFKSPMADINTILASEYAHLMPANIFDYLFAPLKNTIATKFVGHENPYFEPKMALTFFAVLFSLFINKLPNIKEKLESIIDLRLFTISILFIVIGYYGNALIYGTLRYVIALAVICSYVIVALSLTYCKSFKGRIFYPVLIGILLWSCVMYYFEPNTKVVDNWMKKIITVEKVKVEDNSTILCGNQASCTIAPNLNKNVKYMAFTIPEEVAKESTLWFAQEDYKNYYYHSEYLENKVKEAFEKEDNLYILFNPFGFKPDTKVYLKSLKYYSNGKIKTLENCQLLRFSIMTSIDGVFFCKLK